MSTFFNVLMTSKLNLFLELTTAGPEVTTSQSLVTTSEGKRISI